MAKIFISYRREDSQYAVDRIYEALHKRLKKRDIFMDVDDIPKGVDFVDYLSAKVAQCETLVAVIGPQWLSVTNKSGERRLDDPDDFVRIEIAAALKRGIPVVPVLLDGTPMPTAAQLPEDMRGFERRNGAEVHRRSLKADIDALVSDLGYAGGGAPWGKILGGGLVSAAAALGVFAWLDPLDLIPDGPSPEPAPTLEASVPEPALPIEDTIDDVETAAPQAADPTEDPAARTEAIRGLQRALRDFGLYTSVIDGEPGPGTRRAVSEFVSEAGGPAPDLEAGTISDIDALTARIQRASRALAESEGFAWAKAQSNDTVTGYRAYLEEFPAGPNASAASSRIRALERESAVQAEATAWNRAQASNTISAYQAYLRDYPSGTNASAARSRIAALTPPPEPSYRAGQTFRDALSGGGRGPELVVIPSGSFRMGSENGDSDETPVRTIRIGYEFAVGKFEVTWAEWEACVADVGCNGAGPEGAGGDHGWGKGSRPVINVSWNDAQAYVQWLSRKMGERYRLLSEAEWEYVARAGTSTPFYFGETITPDQANHDGNYTYNGGPTGTYHRKTMPVGSYPRNAFGLYDLHGNVWEWVEDCYVDSYSGGPTDGSDRIVNDCSRRVLRGGSWYDAPQYLRSANRIWNDPTVRSDGSGFRVARSLED